MKRIAPEFSGDWRITEMAMWDTDALDLVAPASLYIESDGTGNLNFIAVDASVDCRVRDVNGKPSLEFSWQGWTEGDQISGRGCAILEQNELRGRLFIHLGDESAFVARHSTGGPAGD